jgi:hypothetical protein
MKPSVAIVALFALTALMGACSESSPQPQQTPLLVVVTATPMPPTPTQAVVYVVVTATPPEVSPTPVPTATIIPPTQTPFVIVVTATRAPTAAPAPRPTQVTPTTQPSGFIYAAPSISGNCGQRLVDGPFVLNINSDQPLKEDEVFDVRARRSDELDKPGWRGLTQTREYQWELAVKLTHWSLNGWEGGEDNSPASLGSKGDYTFWATAAIIRAKDGQLIAQLSSESNSCQFIW